MSEVLIEIEGLDVKGLHGVTAKEQKRPLRLNWREWLAVAFRGLMLGVRGHTGYFVHFFLTALVLVAAVVLQCELWQWCVLLGAVGMVLVAELFHSSAWRAMAESAAGSLAVTDGNEQAARQHFDAARNLYERAGQPYWAQRAMRLASMTPA